MKEGGGTHLTLAARNLRRNRRRTAIALAALVVGRGGMDVKAPPPEEQWPALLAADKDGALNGEAVRISGMLVSATPGDRRVGYLPLATAQRVLRMEGRVTEYALALEPLEQARRVRDALRTSLGPGYVVHTWEEVFPFIAQILGQQDFLFGILSSVFLAAVLLGIVNVMLMNVLERVREVGTMLAVGVRRSQVLRLFLLEAAVLGVVGGVAGMGLGAVIVGVLGVRGIASCAAPSSASTPNSRRATRGQRRE